MHVHTIPHTNTKKLSKNKASTRNKKKKLKDSFCILYLLLPQYCFLIGIMGQNSQSDALWEVKNSILWIDAISSMYDFMDMCYLR